MSRSVLVTGCSSGFGLDVSVALARKGWQVFPSMRNLAKRERLDKALADAGVGDRATVVELDVDAPESIEAAANGVFDATDARARALADNARHSSSGSR